MLEPACEVLLVEDESDLREQMRQLVSSWGYNVRTAPTVPDALALLENRPPDIILTDLVLSPDSGAQVLSFAQHHWPELPVLVMTAFATLENAVETLKLGAYDYLLKPFSPHELSAALLRARSSIQLRQLRLREERLRHLTAVALTLTHELNNPLAIISGEIQLLLEEPRSDADRHSLHICLEAAHRITDVVRRLGTIRDIAYRDDGGFRLLDLEHSPDDGH